MLKNQWLRAIITLISNILLVYRKIIQLYQTLYEVVLILLDN